MTVITGNRQLAARARDLASQAAGGSLERRASLVVAIALEETRSTSAARRILDDYADRGDELHAAATDLLDQLGQEGTDL